MAEPARLLVDAMLAANVALLLSFAILLVLEWGLAALGLSRAWDLRRRLTVAAWLLAPGLPAMLAAGWLPQPPVNATDLVVAQFLRGNLALSATDLSELIALRGDLPRALTAPEGPLFRGFAALILAAALGRALWVALSAFRLAQIIRTARPVRRIRGLRIAVSPDCPVPFAARGLRRHIVLPPAVWADPDLRGPALAHELQHLRQGDPTAELLIALVSPLFALNPAFWALARRTRRLREHGCDAACIARGGTDARTYALCLLSVARSATARRVPGTLTVALLGRRQMTRATTRSQLGHRIELIASGPGREAGHLATLAAIGLLAAGVGGGLWLARAPDGWSQERLMLSSVVNLERLDAINGLGQRPLR